MRRKTPKRTHDAARRLVIGAVVLVVLLALVGAVRIVRIRANNPLPTRQGGRYAWPGLVFINPLTDRTNWVDLREQFLEIPHQTAITKDNASISIDFIIFYKVVDPEMSVLKVQNFASVALNVAATTLRSVVGDMHLDDVLSKRETNVFFGSDSTK